MALDPAARVSMLAAVPRLRAFALSLCRSPDRADDLVQETLVRACENIGTFTPGSNMNAWLTACATTFIPSIGGGGAKWRMRMAPTRQA
jgi:DNA-directed RNA polymerase specialized sigma24 family protein